MKIWRWIIGVVVLTVILAAVWVVWQRPQPVEMASYVPAETLVYLEANDLPLVLSALTETGAWRELAPIYGVNNDYGKFGWLSQMLANTNLGSTETIIFGRSQIAVAMLATAAKDDGENSLKIKPNFAVVIETKSSRAAGFVENSVTGFARKQFGEIRVEKRSADGAAWTIFRSVTDERNLFAAVSGTTAVIGNDETAVQSCLDAKNGKRKNLAEDENLSRMRTNTEAAGAFAFGMVTTEGVKKLSEIGAVFAAGQFAEDPRAMSLLAQSLPPFFQKSVTAIGWTARKSEAKIEDRYFVQMPPDLIARLREPLAAQERGDSPPAALLPADLQSVTVYNLKNPQTAWRGFLFALQTRLDALSAAAFASAAGGLLEPYGVEKADDFLGATSGVLSTVRLTNGENQTIAAVGVKNADTLKAALKTDGEKKSEFVNDFLLLGTDESLQICRTAREQNKTLNTQGIWQKFNDTKSTPSGTFVRTLTRDAASTSRFVKLFARETNEPDTMALPAAESAPDWFWIISETRLMRDGFERRTVSPFGLIGTLATSFGEK